MAFKKLSNIPSPIFRAYDIRGVVDETITPDVVYTLGLAIGSQAQEQGERTIVTARDGRLSGPELQAALNQGLQDSGCDVINIGSVPTPLLYFATNILSAKSGVMLTGSHNPANHNGLKMVIGGQTLSEEGVYQLHERIQKQDFKKGVGKITTTDVVPDYIATITKDIKLKRPLRIVIDAGNGIAGGVAPALFRALGCEVVEWLCEVDGNFPNHHPDPSVLENLHDLIEKVQSEKADIGFAFDGDGDRLGVVTNKGEVIWPDRQLMLYAIDILSRHPGETIIYDVKSTRDLDRVIKEHGGKPLMWKTGHSLIKRKLQEMGGLLAGEMSGHIFFKERWYGFDDGLYVGARLLEILAASGEDADTLFSTLPNSINTPELKLPIADDRKFIFMKELGLKAKFNGATITTIDGLRVDFADGWGLVRPSNTTPCLTLRFEAENAIALQRIQQVFREQLLAMDDQLKLPF